MTMRDVLPPEILQGAVRQGTEYGWKLDEFPGVLRKAQALGYACVGGQFQCRTENGGICQMYWLNADSMERAPDEPWSQYSQRSCQEVLNGFQRLMARTDFVKEIQKWRDLKAELAAGLDITSLLVFVAYFIDEPSVVRLRLHPHPDSPPHS